MYATRWNKHKSKMHTHKGGITMDIVLSNHIVSLITSFIAILCSLLAIRMSHSASQRTEYLTNKVDFMKDRIDNQQAHMGAIYVGMHDQMNRIEMMVGRLEGRIEKEK